MNYKGLKVKGLKRACGQTQDYRGTCLYSEIFYDVCTGEVWTNTQTDGSWSVYPDDDVIKICNTKPHMTMKEILERICECI